MQLNYDNQVIIGLMSGSSLDGLDLVACSFCTIGNKIEFNILSAETLEYNSNWKNILSNAFHKTKNELEILDKLYSEYLASCINEFVASNNLHPVLIGSHGHTVFHKPEKGITVQIGNGQTIRSLTGISTISNFRAQDIKLNGQGAPLVPIGDEYLFGNYNFCLNLGGFSNVSWSEAGIRKACDISPCNILLNNLANRIQLDFDQGGENASKGNLIPSLFNKWNEINFYFQSEPKSLGREWFEYNFLNDLLNDYSIEDLLRTAIEHISFQIAKWINSKSNNKIQNVLVSGGGTYNELLFRTIQNYLNVDIYLVKADDRIINYKEALIFALLAYLRIRGMNNVLASVTGALQDHSSGDVFL